MEETNVVEYSRIPAEAGIHFDTIKEKIPSWLYRAAPEIRLLFREHLLALETSRHEVRRIMAQLQKIDVFCTPLLVQALERQINSGQDLQSARFVRVDATYLSSIFEDKFYTFSHSQTLLEAALQNFEAGETLSGALSGKAVIQFPAGAAGINTALAPEDFAWACRTLNLGALYQAHIDSVFNPPGQPSANGALSVKQHFAEYDKQTLAVTADIAYMKGEITATTYALLLELVKGQAGLRLGGELLHHSRMKMFDIELSGWVVIGAKLAEDSTLPCIAYIPDDPRGPLKYYRHFLLFEHDLTLKLRDPSYRQFFARFVPEEHRLRFLRTLNARLLSQDRTWPPVPAIFQYIPLTEVPIEGDLFESFQQQRYRQIKAHARLLAVPTADVDARVRQARLDAYREAGLSLLALALSFVPVIGQIILAAAAVKMVVEVYDGFAAWQLGEKREALGYLLGVVEDLALLAAGAVVVKGGKALFKTLSPSSVDALIPVEAPGGRRRLWRADLAPYERDIRLPEYLEADAMGLYPFQDNLYLPLEGKVYAVRYDRARLQWQIEHPEGEAFHAVPLRFNRTGVWQTIYERVADWPVEQLFRRLGEPMVGLGNQLRLKIRQFCSAQENVLRKALADNQPVPALLLDTIKRFRIDQAISDFIGEVPDAISRTLEQGDLRLRLLTSLPDWPENRVVQVFNGAGEVMQEYGRRTGEQFSSLQIIESQLKNGNLLQSTLNMLSEPERQTLFGAELTDNGRRVRVLSQRLRQWAGQRRQWLFDELYAASEKTDDDRVNRILGVFPGLPGSVARELIAHANSAELDLLSERVPLRFSEEISWYLKQLRLNRVCESWYLLAPQYALADRLALHTLGRLPGWPAKGLRIELREQRFTSEALETAGDPDITTPRVILKVARQYNAFDHSGTLLGRADNIFDAMVRALPEPDRVALGFRGAERGAWLKEQIVAQVARDPYAAQDTLGLSPFSRRFRPPMRLASGRIGYPMSDVGRVLGYSERLIGRVRDLYPGFSSEEVGRFLTSLHLPESACLVELERLRGEYEVLFTTLDKWVQRQTWRRVRGTLQVAPVALDNKQRVADAILACWRKQSNRNRLGGQYFYELDLLGMRVGDLPAISADFSHVGFLFMNDMAVASTEVSFLSCFRQLRWLSMGFNHLGSLPVELGQMSELIHLHLPGNQIVLNRQSAEVLTRLTRLKFLNLSDNPLVQPPDISQMSQLETLLLRHTELDRWPVGLPGLSNLQRVDLRGNRISTIPEAVYSGPVSINRITHLHDNPALSVEGMLRLQRYERETGINFGIDMPGRRHPHALRRTTSLRECDNWLGAISTEQKVLKEQQWQLLHRQQGSADFFKLLADLSVTAEYREAREDLSLRVWQVVEAVSQYSELREELFVSASHPQTCSDGAELIFSDMEIRVLVNQARAMVVGTPATTELNLLKLSRGLWRLDEVESLAQTDIEARLKLPDASGVDPVEVRLAYRIGLTERLRLPGQPKHMTFTELARVTEQHLDAAYAKVLARERTPAYARALADREFWASYLKEHNPSRFKGIDAQHQAAVSALDARRTSRSDPHWHEFIDIELEAQMGDQLRAWREASARETLALTKEILERIPAQELDA
ncbi:MULTISPECIES: NEL-type E3 ubiquitin ligase domain-containing protein [unclassified Pseudomonas]|uniref:NEL-type E3 ubiquitin ligase domain-containing protein n=1 Tax=unclassified Pseudomonas TaxID=196821 RepID=UPI00200EBA39|nr:MULTISPECIES: NEL-type E3 ubiquitin ligase domain-containing protein [unclassified Pseudomonas]